MGFRAQNNSMDDALEAGETSLELVVTETEREHDIFLAAFDISQIGDEFLSFVYYLDVDGVTETETFSDYSEVLAFFEDQIFFVGHDLDLGDLVSATFDVVLEKGSRFDMAVAFASVPEPGTGLLVGLGLMVLCARRRRVY